MKSWLRYLRQLVFNPPVTWVDITTGEETREKMSRKTVFYALRPASFYHRFTKREECGCSRRRVTRRRVLICMDHSNIGKWRERLRNDEGNAQARGLVAGFVAVLVVALVCGGLVLLTRDSSKPAVRTVTTTVTTTVTGEPTSTPTVTVTKRVVKRVVVTRAARSQTGNTVWDRLAMCESSGNWAINTGNGFYGGLQFTLSSWRAVGGSGYPHHASREEQIVRGQRLQAIQGWGAWPACSSKLGLR